MRKHCSIDPKQQLHCNKPAAAAAVRPRLATARAEPPLTRPAGPLGEQEVHGVPRLDVLALLLGRLGVLQAQERLEPAHAVP